jgi:hypothetical protein
VEAPVLRRRLLAKRSSLVVVEEELVSSWRLLQRLLEAVTRQSAVRRMKG